MKRPKRHEVTGEWRKLDHKGLHNLYSSSDIFRIIMKVGKICWQRGTYLSDEELVLFWS
jgi:hypothetical protein